MITSGDLIRRITGGTAGDYVHSTGYAKVRGLETRASSHRERMALEKERQHVDAYVKSRVAREGGNMTEKARTLEESEWLREAKRSIQAETHDSSEKHGYFERRKAMLTQQDNVADPTKHSYRSVANERRSLNNTEAGRASFAQYRQSQAERFADRRMAQGRTNGGAGVSPSGGATPMPKMSFGRNFGRFGR